MLYDSTRQTTAGAGPRALTISICAAIYQTNHPNASNEMHILLDLSHAKFSIFSMLAWRNFAALCILAHVATGKTDCSSPDEQTTTHSQSLKTPGE